MTLPLKTRILEYAIMAKKPVTAEEVTEALKKEYVGERFCNLKNVENLMDSYCGVGAMKAAEISFDEKMNLQVKYQVTSTGYTYEHLIPGHENK